MAQCISKMPSLVLEDKGELLEEKDPTGTHSTQHLLRVEELKGLMIAIKNELVWNEVMLPVFECRDDGIQLLLIRSPFLGRFIEFFAKKTP